MNNFWNYLWLLLLIWTFIPLLRQRRLEWARIGLMRQLEQKRGSRLITLIHRQESLSFLGIPLRRYIDIEDSEQILRAIRLTPADVPIDLLLHTPGGLVLAAEQIAHALKAHPARVTVFVPHYAMSGGTMLALAANEIWMDANAVLGPVDPQIGEFPAVSILRAVEEKRAHLERVDDKTLILADVAEKAIRQVGDFVTDLLDEKFPPEVCREIAHTLTSGKWTHDFPLMRHSLEELGFRVETDLPEEIYRLMDLYPQSGLGRPSVQYIPVPYSRQPE